MAPSYPRPFEETELLTQASADQEPLPIQDPVAFLQKCLDRYDVQHIQGYRCVFQKQERVGGVLQPSEVMDAAFRTQPFSVFLRWIQGTRRAASMLFVEGANDNQMLIRPAGLAGSFVNVVARDPEGTDARQAGRYTVKEFGLRNAAARSLRDWKAAQKKGTLKVHYLGVRKVRELGDRLCYTLRRTCPTPEQDGLTEVTLYIDKETWFQVGSVLKGEKGKLLGEYLFRDIQLNPKFKPNQFERSALTS
jgi:hypothetical protein